VSKPPKKPKVLATNHFSSVFEDYAPKLKRFLKFRLKNDTDAEDIAQEAYFRLCRIKNPDLVRQPDAYLFTIASNLASEFLLKQNKRPVHVNIDNISEHEKESLEKPIEKSPEIMKLESILTQLPPLYQAILLMRKRDGYSHQEIADQLEISPNTVHKYLTRALAKCRELWIT